MGLFKKKEKKLCPICGNVVSWFLPIKWNDQPLCDDCGSKLAELPGDIRSKVEESETSIREYFAVFDENKALRGKFQTTYKYDPSLFGGCICLDIPQRLLRLKDSGDAFVFEPDNILSFRILEDTTPLFEGTRDELVYHPSTAPDQVRSQEHEIELMRIEIRHCDEMQRMEDHMEEQARMRGENYMPRYISTPDPNCFKPFDKFHIYLELEHPYRKEQKEFKQDAPGFNSSTPSVQGYVADYSRTLEEIRTLANNLMAVMNPDAPMRQVDGPAEDAPVPLQNIPIVSNAQVDPVDEIQKYKALFDSGVITEDEFTAKKRQLMGI